MQKNQYYDKKNSCDMKNFNNKEYKCLVTDLIGDAFYTETSFRGKISTIRQYAEVIVRKLLDIEPSKHLTLGQENIRSKIKNLPNHEYIEAAIAIIRTKGNLSTHTQYLDNLSLEDFEDIVDNLFNMLSFPLINYFEKYEFGSRDDVLLSFSLLPPIIRYKVLNFLYQKNPCNLSVIDKLVLAIVKAFSVFEATKWIEERKDTLIKMKTISEKAFNAMLETVGIEIAMDIQKGLPSSMYHLCKEKISQIGLSIDIKGHLYSDFESALPYYKANGILNNDNLETKEFNDIMDFLYLGRKEKLQKISIDRNPYIVMNFIS